MNRNIKSSIWSSLLLCYFFLYITESCNEIVCASIVSKCMLTSACKCEMKNCSCCTDCLKCLGKKYYEECCSCVELCPKPNDTRNFLSKKSHVEEFDGVPELFNVLTSSQGDEYEWKIFTFEVDFDTVLSGPKLERDVKYFLKTSGNSLDGTLKHEDLVTLNCTVIYLDQCTSWNKCRQSCQSTGASSYRWFHDGCCECVGSTCINYGINESRCQDCPDPKEFMEISDENFEDNSQDFGDTIGPLDGPLNNKF